MLKVREGLSNISRIGDAAAAASGCLDGLISLCAAAVQVLEGCEG